MCFISAGLFTHVKSWRERGRKKKREREREGGEVFGQRAKKDSELRRERAVRAKQSDGGRGRELRSKIQKDKDTNRGGDEDKESCSTWPAMFE